MRVAADVERLHTALDEAQSTSALPDTATGHEALHDFVVRVRLDDRGVGSAPVPPGD
ncbi:hypothetical protein ACF09H_31350 [Streptomyces sp. NPDC014983]|uniref:hypothetical protein n=1 Tax=Streptomyces sp. NPDC014983 TaxID=3364933 RepID=UPI00370017AF